MLINDDSLRRLNLSTCPNSELYAILQMLFTFNILVMKLETSVWVGVWLWVCGSLGSWKFGWVGCVFAFDSFLYYRRYEALSVEKVCI